MEKKLKKWQIGSRLLEFDEESHTYFVDGKICPSVTQIIKSKFPDKYKHVRKNVLEKSRQLGKELHLAIEVFEKYGLERDDLIEFKNYKILKEIYEFKVIGNEIPVIFDYENLTICGTVDLLTKSGNSLGLSDIKRTTKLDEKYLALQLNLYRLAYEQCYEKKVEFLRGIHLKQKTRNYVTVAIDEKAAIEFLDEYINEN